MRRWLDYYWNKYKPALIFTTITLGLAVIVLLGYGSGRLAGYKSSNAPNLGGNDVYNMDDLDNQQQGAFTDFDSLGLYYEVRLEGIDGENFIYSIYFESEPDQNLIDTLNMKIGEAYSAYNENIDENYGEGYVAYVGELEREGERKYTLCLDLGSARDDSMVSEILKIFNQYEGIEKIILNEGGV